MKPMKMLKILTISAALSGFISVSTKAAVEVDSDPDSKVVCYCNPSHQCRANADGRDQCNATNQCADYDSLC